MRISEQLKHRQDKVTGSMPNQTLSLPFFFRDSVWNRRRLLRFSVQVENRGLDHFRPSVDKSKWQWHKCHKHYHSMETFSSYDLLSKYSLKTKCLVIHIDSQLSSQFVP